MADLAVSASFKAVDKISGAFKRMGKSAGFFEDKTSKAFRRASKSASRFKDITKGILTAGAISRGVGLLTNSLRAAGQEFINFDDSITQATSRFMVAEKGIRKTSDVMADLRKSAREAGATTQFSASQAAEGLNFFARAGFSSTEAMSVLTNQIDLATATGEDFARVADISSDLLGSLGLNSENSAVKIANLKKMNNLLAIATNSANVTMEDLFETIKDVGPIATKAGESQEKLIAITAALGGAGIKGSMAATALKNSYIRLLDITPKMAKELENVGLEAKDFIDTSGKMKSMTTIMALLGKKTAKLGQAEQLRFFATIFGKRAVAGAANLSKSLGQVDKTLKSMKDVDAMKKIADQMRTSLGPRIEIIKSGLIEIAFKIFTAFEKRGKKALDVITKAVQDFDPQPIIDGMETVIDIIGAVISVIKPIAPIIQGLAIAWGVYATATTIAAVAQWALNAAFAVSPMGLIVAGIGLIIGAGLLLIKHWDAVKGAFVAVWDFIKRLFFTGADIVLFFLGGMIKGIISGVQLIGKAFNIKTPALDKAIQKIEGLQKFVQQRGNFPVSAETGEDSRTPGPVRQAPNEREANARQFVLKGRIDIAAPEGTTGGMDKRSVPGVDMNFLGAQ